MYIGARRADIYIERERRIEGASSQSPRRRTQDILEKEKTTYGKKAAVRDLVSVRQERRRAHLRDSHSASLSLSFLYSPSIYLMSFAFNPSSISSRALSICWKMPTSTVVDVDRQVAERDWAWIASIYCIYTVRYTIYSPIRPDKHIRLYLSISIFLLYISLHSTASSAIERSRSPCRTASSKNFQPKRGQSK